MESLSAKGDRRTCMQRERGGQGPEHIELDSAAATLKNGTFIQVT